MDAYDRCTNLGEKILPIALPSMVEAENFSDHPHILWIGRFFLVTVFIKYNFKPQFFFVFSILIGERS